MRRRFLRLLAVGLLAAGWLVAQKKPVTVEVLAEPDPATAGDPVWAPDGESFAFVLSGELYVFDLARKRRKRVVKLGDLEERAVEPERPEAFGWQNRRVREQQVQWLPGKRLLVKAGGDLFLVNSATGDWEALTETARDEEDPKLSPDGTRVSFQAGGDLYVLEIESRQLIRLTRTGSETRWNGKLDWVYPEELGLGTAHWWSPDSQTIAYLEFDVSRVPLFPHADFARVRALFEPQRYPKAGEPNPEVRLGVIPSEGGRTRWFDLGDPRSLLIGRVQWIGNDRLAVLRLNRIQNRLDLLFVDAGSGRVTTVLSETGPYWVNLSDAFHFFSSRPEFLWSSERDGYRHLYLYSPEGKPVRRLTEGAWEVTELAAVDEKRGEVYYLSNESSPLERHLYRIGLDGSGKQRVTGEPGSHAVSMSPAGNAFMDAASALDTPPRRTVRSAVGAEIAEFERPFDDFAKSYETLPAEIVTVKAPDGAALYAKLIKPKGFTAGRRYPAVVLVYGGPHAQSVRHAWSGRSWEQVLAQRGFVVWQLDNRGTAGRGHAWESAVFRKLGFAELADQVTGLEHLLSLGFVDAERVGIHGWSYGGFMTLFAMLKEPKRFRAGVAGAPVTDWLNYDTIYTERYMGLPSENEEGYRTSSPVHFAAGLEGELMLVHNLEDDNVHFQNTVRMADALVKAGKHFETLFYAHKAHGVATAHRKHFYEAMTRFFEKHLKP